MIRIQRRPELELADAQTAVREFYGMHGALTPLPGERDQNFLLHTPEGAHYVVKVSSPEEPDDVLRFETEMLVHIAGNAKGLVPGVLQSVEGEYLVSYSDPEGASHRIRVVEFLPGTLLANVRPRSASLLRDLGRRVAALDSELGSYPDHPPARIGFEWALGNSGTVMERCLELLHGEQRRLIDRVLRAFARRGPEFLGLGSQIIHGDLNDHNILVSDPSTAPRHVTGFIDFGDAHSAPRVFDLAIAVAYAILGTADPLTAAAAVVGGFHESTPLSREEVDVIFALARARLGSSVSIAAWRRREAAVVDDYLLVTETPAWDMLRTLDEIGDDFACAVLRDACGMDASVSTAALSQWLSKQAPFPVIDLPPDAGITVLDLSMGSADVTGRDTDDTEAFTNGIFRRMSLANAQVGVGRYLEPRPFYLTSGFAGREGDPRERRTIHLGADLFVEAGTAVRAPLPATVKSVRDNEGRLDYGPTVILEHAGPRGPFWTLYGHLERAALAELKEGASVKAGDPIGRIGTPPENGDWPPHLHFQIVTDLLGHDGDFPGVALPRERGVWASFSPDPNLILRLPADITFRAPKDLSERRARVLGPNLRVSYDEPLHLVRGIGTHLYDPLGRGYLDCVNNVAHVGHEHPSVVRSGQRQMGVLNTNTRYLHEMVIEYAERLVTLFPKPLSVCYFVNSGSEANELALRMARAYTGGVGVVTIEGGYHGHSQGLIDVSHYKFAGEGGAGPPPWVRAVPTPDEYRGRYGREVRDRANRYASHVREAFADLSANGAQPAAFLAESILSCGGQIEPPQGYLSAAYAHARAAGALCVADEVQTGFGRVGSHFWAFQAHGVLPDIVTLGKPMGNGHPLGAVLTTPEIAAAFANGMEFFTTFGGNPVSAAIGLAVLDVIRQERLQEHAAMLGGTLKGELASLAMRHEAVGDIRGKGLFLGVELVSDRATKRPSPEIARYVIQRMSERGVLLSTDGPQHNVLKIKPPMPFSQEDASRLISELDRVLAEERVQWEIDRARG